MRNACCGHCTQVTCAAPTHKEAKLACVEQQMAGQLTAERRLVDPTPGCKNALGRNH